MRKNMDWNKVDGILREAARIFSETLKTDIHADYIAVYSWPQTFTNSNGPKKGGIVMHAFTTFQVIGFTITYGSDAHGLMWCNDEWTKWDGTTMNWYYGGSNG